MSSALFEAWERLRRFDPHCDITIHRTTRPTSGFRQPKLRHAGHSNQGGRDVLYKLEAFASPPLERVWFVTIHNLDAGYRERVQTCAPRLLDALLLAVKEAERRGWGRA